MARDVSTGSRATTGVATTGSGTADRVPNDAAAASITLESSGLDVDFAPDSEPLPTDEPATPPDPIATAEIDDTEEIVESSDSGHNEDQITGYVG